MLASNPIDVLALNETWLSQKVSDNDVYIPRYELVRRDRGFPGADGETYGGVCFYVRSSINFSLRPDLSLDQLENLCIEINKPNSKPFLIVTWYRPPDSTVDKFNIFETLIGKLDSENVEYHLLGDLNCNIGVPVPDHPTKVLTGITELFNLHQLVDEPTRITQSSSTTIDLIFTNDPERIVCSGVSHVGISDHSLIYFYRKLSVGLFSKGHTTVNYRNFKNFDVDKFRSDVNTQNWDSIKMLDNPNQMWHIWKTMFNGVVDRHAPLRKKRVRGSKSPWITADLKERMRQRDVFKIRAIQSRNPHDWATFKSARNSVNSEIKYAKELYYQKAFSENQGNPKKTWGIINEITSRKREHANIKEIKLNGSSITNTEEISEVLNGHFATIGPKLAAEVPLVEGGSSHLAYLTPQSEITFSLKETMVPEVFSLLSKLCKSKATGLDKISAKMLRLCPDLIAESLCAIFNRSINTGIFPDEWKCSKVIPLHKKGDRSDLDNYRPISIIPVVAKVFERIIYNQVYKFLIDTKVLSNCQSGFRSLHSTVTALLEATNTWALNIDRGCVNAVVFLDLKKAFDTVDHGILLSKLNAYGIGGVEGGWFESYLNNRKQKCSVNGKLSSQRSLLCGIPQGTILGPLLFLIYINDLPNCLTHSQARMYADDTHLTFASNRIDDIESHLNEDLANVNKWLLCNKLTLNQSKTEFMLIGSRQRLNTFQAAPILALNNETIKQVPHTKSLGVHIDENLTWNEHIKQLVKKIASGIGSLKRVRNCIPASTLNTIYNSLVQSHFDYCSEVWGSCGKIQATKLQKLQNRAARILTHSNYDTNAEPLIEDLGWKKLDSQRNLQKAVMVYKSLNGLAPDYMQSIFEYRDNLPYQLRDSEHKLVIPKPRTNYGKNSIGYNGAVLWNDLPVGLRQASSLQEFKNGCKNVFQ